MNFKRLFKSKRSSKKASRQGPHMADAEKVPPDENKNLSLPSDSTDGCGLNRLVIHSPNESNQCNPVDIVFVHGLNGHPKRTWTHEKGVFWPVDLLPKDLPGAQIFSYGYNADVMATKSVAKIRDYAKGLLYNLKTEDEQSRPIIYVCHSLGGIVVKQALILAKQQDDLKNLWSRTKAVVFMGTPHRGSAYASYGKTVAQIANIALRVSLADRFTGRARADLIASLTHENDDLLRISEEFFNILKGSTIRTIGFYETEAHPRTNAPIVDQSSACLGGEEWFIPLSLNHQDLCRFSGADDKNYKLVSKTFRSLAFAEPGVEKKPASSLFTHHSFSEIEKICASILNTPNVTEYESNLDTKVDGTLEWVFKTSQYHSWTSNSNARLLWVTGYAGTGKTTLASFISQYLHELHSQLPICSFFCDEKIEGQRDPRTLLRSLIYQIVDKRKKLWQLVKDAVDAGGGVEILGQFDALWELFLKIAHSDNKYPITVIIDAIDEFDQKTQNRVLDRIFKLLLHGNTTSVKFLITSRPNVGGAANIKIRLPNLVQLPLEDNKEEIINDIKFVIRHRLKKMVDSGVCKPSVREVIEKMLVARADQTFLWIKIVLQTLEDRRILLAEDATTIVNSLPEDLESIYEHLLLSIPKTDRDIAAKMLRLLAVSDRPMTGDEIGIILTINSSHKSVSSLTSENLQIGEDSVISVLGPLVRKHDPYIELVHQSLKEYLLKLSNDSQNILAMDFGVDISRDKRTLFQACSTYLSLEEFEQNIYTRVNSIDESDFDSQRTESDSPLSLFRMDYFGEPTTEEDKTTATKNELIDELDKPIVEKSEPSIRKYRSTMDQDGSSVQSGELFYEEDRSIFEENILTNECKWDAVNAKYILFDYAALHWALDFSKCNEIVNVQDSKMAITLCEAKTARLTNWFRYFWYIKANYESFPAVVDNLMVASYFGHISSLRWLLDKSDLINTESLSRALYWAARQGHSVYIETLLEQPDCDPQSLESKSQAPLLAAAQYGQLECVSLLLRDARVSINRQDALGRTALIMAINNNNQEIVTELLRHKDIEVNVQDNQRNAPLHTAVHVGSEIIFLQLLHDERTEIDRLDKNHRDVLSWAAEYGATKFVSSILNKGQIPADQKDIAGRTPLLYASRYGHLSVVKDLIKTGSANPLEKDNDGRNAHSWAASHRNPNTLRYLIKRFPSGADEPDLNGWTPLSWTFEPPGYPVNMVHLLRNGQVNVNRRDASYGRSLLSWIASYGYTQMASELMKAKDIDLEARDSLGRTPLSEAAGCGSLKIMQLLIATDQVDINSQDRQNQTPLSWAAKEGRDEAVAVLLSCPGIKLNIRNSEGETALDVARRFDRGEIAKALENVMGS